MADSEKKDREQQFREAFDGQVGGARPDQRRPGFGKDVVQEASEDSFPASDPPAYTPVSGNTEPSQERLRRERERDHRHRDSNS